MVCCGGDVALFNVRFSNVVVIMSDVYPVNHFVRPQSPAGIPPRGLGLSGLVHENHTCILQPFQVASVFGGVILIYSTYRMPRYSLDVVDSEGHWQPVANALTVVLLRPCTIRGRHRTWKVSIHAWLHMCYYCVTVAQCNSNFIYVDK